MSMADEMFRDSDNPIESANEMVEVVSDTRKLIIMLLTELLRTEVRRKRGFTRIKRVLGMLRVHARGARAVTKNQRAGFVRTLRSRYGTTEVEIDDRGLPDDFERPRYMFRRPQSADD